MVFPQTTFQKGYTNNGNSSANDGIITRDGGNIIAGSILGQTTNTLDIYLVKTNQEGVVSWKRSYGDSNNQWPRSIVQTGDGGYCITGPVLLGNYYGIFLMKVDSMGNLLWVKQFENSGEQQEGLCLKQTLDAGFIISGYTTSMTLSARSDAFLLKTDSVGTKIWSYSYKPTFDEHEQARSVIQLSDSGYVFTGSSGDAMLPLSFWVMRVNKLGSIVWSRYLGSGSGYCISSTFDNGFIVTGIRKAPDWALVLIKIDSLGFMQWNKIYKMAGVESTGYSLQQLQDSGYIVTGISGSEIHADIILIRTNSTGDAVWKQYYGDMGSDVGYSVKENSFGGFNLFGYADFPGSIGRTGFMYKSDSIGEFGCNHLNLNYNVDSFPLTTLSPVSSKATLNFNFSFPTFTTDSVGSEITICISQNMPETLLSDETITIFPIPSDGNFKLVFPEFITCGKLEIYNLLSSIVFTENIENKSEMNIEINNIKSGMYVGTLIEKDRRRIFKLIIK